MADEYQSVDACSRTKAVFLKSPHSPSAFYDIQSWSASRFQQYVRDDLQDQWRPSAAFLVLALLALLAFLAWRLVRCCMRCCCKHNEEEEEEEEEEAVQGGKAGQQAGGPSPSAPEVLRSPLMWGLKAVLLVIILAAVSLSIYGMTQVKKDVVVQGWTALDLMADYSRDISDRMQQLGANASLVLPLIASLKDIADNTVQLSAMKTNISVVGSYLDSSTPVVATLSSQITSVRADLLALNSSTAALSLSSAPALTSTLPGLMAAATTLSTSLSATIAGIGTALAAYQTAVTALPASPPAGGDARITALTSALAGLTPGPWTTTLDTLASALGTFEAARVSNVPAQASSSLTSLSGAVTAGTTDLPALASSLTAYSAALTAVSGTTNGLLTRLRVVNSSVVLLTGTLLSAYSQLSTTQSSLTGVTSLSPGPTAAAATLNTLAGQLVLPSGSTALTTDLTALGAALSSAPAAAPITSFIATLRPALVALTAPLATATSALTAYTALPSNPTRYNTLLAALTPPLTGPVAAAQAAATLPAATQTAVSGMQVAAGAVNAPAGRVVAALPALTASVAALRYSVVSNAPADLYLGYQSALTSLTAAYATLPTPKSAALAPVSAALTIIDAAVLAAGTSATSAINATATSVLQAARDLRQQVPDRVVSARESAYKETEVVGSIYYNVSLAVFGLGLLVLLALLLSVAFNCRGLLCAVIAIVHVVIIVYFLCSLLVAVGAGTQNDACPAVEPVVLHNVGSKWKPLASYYLSPSANSSNGSATGPSAALASAQLVNISDIDAQIASVRSQISGAVYAAYTPVGQLSRVLLEVTAALDQAQAAEAGLLQRADVNQFMPVYLTTKGYFCCTLSRQVIGVWNAWTFAGWLMLVACWVSSAILGVLDGVPGARASCCCCCCCAAGPSHLDRVQPDQPHQHDQQDGPRDVIQDKPHPDLHGKHDLHLQPQSGGPSMTIKAGEQTALGQAPHQQQPPVYNYQQQQQQGQGQPWQPGQPAVLQQVPYPGYQLAPLMQPYSQPAAFHTPPPVNYMQQH